MTRVLIVEDSPTVAQLLVEVLGSAPNMEVVGVARGGEEAIAMVPRLRPDVVTMDVHMPGMDGYQATRAIMETHPVPIVVVTASWDASQVDAGFMALASGAVAIVGKPVGPMSPAFEATARALVEKVRLMAEIRVVRRRPRPVTDTSQAGAAPGVRPEPSVEVVGIGASTGGPPAICEILAALCGKLPVPVLVVQHIAPGFVQGLADWLSRATGVPVDVARQDERLESGRAYLAPDGAHMEVRGPGVVRLVAGAAGENVCPAVGRMFRSLASTYGPAAAGVLCTGMGRDGAVELLEMRRAGAVTVAQDRESSVVHGMPGEAITLGAATHVLAPPAIGWLLRAILERR